MKCFYKELEERKKYLVRKLWKEQADNEWKILVASLGDYQALSRTGICREQMLINYNDKTTKN